ncbi:hypothetical protein [Mucilaginibacter sp. UYCu711]|uniref:hypothetical protein n=1 Tax=Mucilaginibacter sp. UYCu711 TaxID=3156339 RepID=UPI003D1FABF1
MYANGVFVGIDTNYRNFLKRCKEAHEIMATLFGGLSRSSFAGINFAEELLDFYYPFSKTDKDALNNKLDFIRQEAMAVKSGAALMPNVGLNKPWTLNTFALLFDVLARGLLIESIGNLQKKPLLNFISCHYLSQISCY